jgi:hypothetical protein
MITIHHKESLMAKKINRQQTEAQINMRAWEDPAFKKQLSENPRNP